MTKQNLHQGLHLAELVDDLLRNLHDPKGRIEKLKEINFNPNDPIDLPHGKNFGKGWTLLHHIAVAPEINDVVNDAVEIAKAEKVNLKQVLDFLCEAFPQIDLNPPANFGNATPFHLACFNNNCDFAEAVIEMERLRNPHFMIPRIIQAVDIEGNTALHYAATSEEAEDKIIKFLLDNGADKEVKNNNNETPLDLAKRAHDERKKKNFRVPAPEFQNINYSPEEEDELQKTRTITRQLPEQELSQDEWEGTLSPAAYDYYSQACRTLETKLADNSLRENSKLRLLGAAARTASAFIPFGVALSAGAEITTKAVEFHQKNHDEEKIEKLADKRFYRDLAEKTAREMTVEELDRIAEVSEEEMKEKGNFLPQLKNGVEKFFYGVAKSAPEKLAINDSNKIAEVIVGLNKNEEMQMVLESEYEDVDQRNKNIAKSLVAESKKLQEVPSNTIAGAATCVVQPLVQGISAMVGVFSH